MSHEHFDAVVKVEFHPRLRAAGFKGSGRHFRRVCGEVIHAITFWGNRQGGSCALDMGIHAIFLPYCWGAACDVRKITEGDCEFRKRLSPDHNVDHWWSYGADPATAESSARSLAETYFRVGEPYLQQHSSIPSILDDLKGVADTTERYIPLLGGKTTVRAALAASRIHRHCGNIAESRRFAQYALANLGRASLLKAELETLANQPVP